MHRIITTPISVCILLLCVAAPAFAEPIMPVKQIRPGMRGYGLTVLRGTTPERFDVEVIDVLHQFLTRQDLILIRMRHPTLEHSGTVGGMSGSPIYIQGRLIGALAYGWYYAMDPIAGVTPIESMIEELSRPTRPIPVVGSPLPAAGLRRTPPPAAAAAAPTAGGALSSLLGPTPPYWQRFRDTEGPVPAVTPLQLGGFSTRVRRMLGELLGDYGLVPLEGGGAGPREALPAAGERPFQPGSAIGVQLVRGDLSATGIGTVTTLRGSRVLAFGHPMFNFGQTRFPVTTARILTILASRRRSFKLGEPVAEAGALVQDRQPCIIADTNVAGPMTALDIRLHDRTTRRRDRYQVEVVRDRFLLPAFGISAVAAALERFASDRADLTVTMRGTMHMPGRSALVLEDQAVTEIGTGDARTLFRMRPLAALRTVLRNEFEPVVVDRMEVDVTLDFRRDAAEIVSAYVTTEEPEAGSRVSIHVVIRPFDGPEEVRIVPIRIPRDAAGQQVQIDVTGGSGARPPVPPPQSLDDVIRNLRRTFPSTSMVVTMTRRGQGIAVRGHVAEHLPPSALDALQPLAQDAGARPLRTALQVTAPAGRVLAGRARIRLRVRPPDA